MESSAFELQNTFKDGLIVFLVRVKKSKLNGRETLRERQKDRGLAPFELLLPFGRRVNLTATPPRNEHKKSTHCKEMIVIIA